jgi:hypothetical protein
MFEVTPSTKFSSATVAVRPVSVVALVALPEKEVAVTEPAIVRLPDMSI